MYIKNFGYKCIAAIVIIAIAYFLFNITAKPDEEKVLVLRNPTLMLEQRYDSKFRITSNNSPIYLTADSSGAFVLDVDQKEYISTKDGNYAYSIVPISGSIKEVDLQLAKDVVKIELKSEEEIEITKSREEEISKQAIEYLTVLFLILFYLFILE